MGCILVLLACLCPRLVMFIIWLTTTWFQMAYETTIWPVLGFLFMPFTTLAYMAAMINNDHQVTGWWLVLLIVAVLTDLGSSGNATKQRGST